MTCVKGVMVPLCAAQAGLERWKLRLLDLYSGNEALQLLIAVRLLHSRDGSEISHAWVV